MHGGAGGDRCLCRLPRSPASPWQVPDPEQRRLPSLGDLLNWYLTFVTVKDAVAGLWHLLFPGAGTRERRELSAYHECGHVLVALHSPGALPVRSVSVRAYGPAWGVTRSDGPRGFLNRTLMLLELRVLMGGRAAEEIVYGPGAVTIGAGSDIRQVCGGRRGGRAGGRARSRRALSRTRGRRSIAGGWHIRKCQGH